MDLNEYQRLAMLTDSEYKNCKDRLLNGLMGLCGESGEAIDIAKKHLFQGHGLDYGALIEEIGDILWYIALCASAMGVSLEAVAYMNIAKLKRRYPNGFRAEDSINRDIPLFHSKTAVWEELNEETRNWEHSYGESDVQSLRSEP